MIVQLWWIAQTLLVRSSPQFLYGWRRFILRTFGAKIGKEVLIRPSVRVTYPWRVEIGDYSWIGDNVELYSLDYIKIGRNVCVSQGSFLCTGSHNRQVLDFAMQTSPIVIDDEAWLASQVFVAPGVRVGTGAFVGVRSLVLSDIDSAAMAVGQPARVIGTRQR